MNRRELLVRLGAVGAVTAARKVGASTAPPDIVRRVPRAPSAADLATQLTESIAKHKVPGANAAIYRDGRFEVAAAGVVNVTTSVPTTPETVMHIGSITKTLNATLIMQLVDEGKIDLGQPLKRYLPDFRVADRDASQQITVQMLLNHTSGIDGELIAEHGPDAERVEDAIPRIAELGQIHAPGAELSYCNSAVVLAGYLAQRITGKSWYVLVKERIFEPLELEHSVVLPADALLHRASVGHFLNGSDGVNRRTSFAFLPLSFAPAGATAMMSAKDLVTFALAHCHDGVAPNGHRLVSAESAIKMRRTTATWRGVGFADVGLGWMVSEKGVISHGGGGPGILSWLYAHPESKTVVAVLTNGAHAAPVLNQICNPVLASFGGKPINADAAEMAKRATDAPVDPTRYVGTYESVTTANRIVPLGKGIGIRSRAKVKFYDFVSLEETSPVQLRPIDHEHFALGPAVFTFLNPGQDGRMQHVASGGRLLRRTA